MLKFLFENINAIKHNSFVNDSRIAFSRLQLAIVCGIPSPSEGEDSFKKVQW